MEELVNISGTVDTIVYRNDDNGYAVLRILSEDGEEITATGYIPGIGLGEELSLVGNYTTHPSYGEQFNVEYFERRLPASVKGIEGYLSSGIVKGIGAKLARKIAEKFGEDTFDVISYEPEKLTDIKGITPKKAYDIQEQFLKQTEMRMVMEFLTENGLPISLAARLYNRLKGNAIEALQTNPYLLCDEYYDVDFRVADYLAINLGLSMCCSERISAGIIYTLRFNLQNGHTFIPVDKLLPAVSELLKYEDNYVDVESIKEVMDNLIYEEKLYQEHICGKDAIYLKQMYSAETFLSDYLYELANIRYDYDFEPSELVDALESHSEIAYAPLQRRAIECASKSGLVILTGGPGTGKTTTVKGMIDVFEALELDVVLAAPTGRAAKRLSDLCGVEAKTIHRLLEAGYYGRDGKLSFQRNKNNPIEADVVILDEVSMVDIVLMQALLESLSMGTRLILVGDSDQLPPVGPGNFLRDLISSQKIDTIELNEIFRQAQQSNIVTNAHAINKGNMPMPSGKSGDFFIMKKSAPADVISTITELCKDRLPKFYGLKPSQIQVLTPSKKQGAGTFQLNRMLQDALNPPSPTKNEQRYGELIFREGDRIMQVRNNYDIVWQKENSDETGMGMFNGDVGEIISVDKELEIIITRFDDKIAEYSFDMLGELELAYAMTVHKSQGSEFDAVVIALSSGMSKRLLTRNILYTAITRAKGLLVIVGSNDVIEYMVNTNTKNKRYSALKARLIGKDDN